MKKILTILLALCLAMSFGAAGAEGLRHQVTGDDSTFTSSEETTQILPPDETAATPLGGTEVWLYVDGDTASYVTFVVVDDDGNPIKGASIFLSFGGYTEFFGTTDADGRFSTYLFRDTTYGYRVEKSGYATVTGSFSASGETKTVRVVLQKYRDVYVIIQNQGEPFEGVQITINGQTVTTGKDGSTRFDLVNGVYDAQITLPDGTVKDVTIRVEGDSVFIIDVGLKDMPEALRPVLNAGGGDSDQFIVFDKHYDPEDYDLTMHVFRDWEILAQYDTDEMEEEEIAAIVEAYHLENEDFLHIVAEPDKIQHVDENGEALPDEIVVDEEERPVYSQRSLILSGWQLLNTEAAEMESIRFENENFGVWFDIADLYSEDMAKLFKLMQAIHKNPRDYKWYDAATFEVSEVDFTQLDEVWRWIDPEEERYSDDPEIIIPEFHRSTFGNSRLEVRITPVLEEEVLRALPGTEPNVEPDDLDEVVLISADMRAKWIREFLADGHMTNTEFAELKLLCSHSKAYRVQIFLRIDGTPVNVTTMLPSMEIRFDVNEEAQREADEYAAEQLAIQAEQIEAGLIQPEDVRTADDFREEYWLTLYDPAHGLYGVNCEGPQVDDEEYLPGDAVFELPAALTDGVPELEETLRAMESRRVDVYDVDVRYEEIEFRKIPGKRFFSVPEILEDVAIPVVRDWRLNWETNLSGLHLIREIGCDCLNDLMIELGLMEPVETE